jgi:hypothetical protein
VKPSALAWYLPVIVTLQVLLYAVWSLGTVEMFFYLDPRLGLLLLQEVLSSRSRIGPGLLSWLSAAWLGYIAVSVGRSPRALRLYRLSEPVLALPSLAVLASTALPAVRRAISPSLPEILIPTIVFVVFTVVPYVLALRTAPSRSHWS